MLVFRCRRPEPLFNLLQECIIRAGQEERLQSQISESVSPTANHHRTRRQNPGTTDLSRLRTSDRSPNGNIRNGTRLGDLHAARLNPRIGMNGIGGAGQNERLLLSNWAGADEHRARLMNSGPIAPAPNSLYRRLSSL